MRPYKLLSIASLGASLGQFCVLAGVTMSIGILAAKAQTIDEIVVTSRKVAESLQDVPIAVTAFSEADIEDAGISRPEDFISLTPNVTMVNTANAGDTQVTIRGITSTRDAESNFALVVDGVLVTNPNGFNRELLDISQIEVLKGPQGALYGRNASSGAILITTKKPTDDDPTTALLGFASEGGQKFQAAKTFALAPNAMGRFSFSTRQTDGFEENIYTNADDAIDYFEDTTLRGRVVIDEGRSSWDLRGGYSDVSGGAINFNATFALPGFAAAFTNPEFHADVNAHEFQYFPNIKPENEQETLDFSAQYTVDLDSGNTLTTTLSYNELDEYLLSDGTSASFNIYDHLSGCQEDLNGVTSSVHAELINGFPATYVANLGNKVVGPYTSSRCDGYQYQERNQSDMSIELKLTSADGSWIIGGYLAQIEREVVVAYGADTGAAIARTPYIEGQTDLLFWDDFETDVMSVFGQYTYDMDDMTEIAFEGRFDVEDRSVSNQVPKVSKQAVANGAAQPINPGRTNVNDDIPDRSEEFEQFQPKVSLRRDLNENTNLYASYGVGFRSGGFNSQGSKGLIDSYFNAGGIAVLGDSVRAGLDVKDQYEKEVSTAFELGLKGRYMDGRLQLNAAIFQTDVEDNQFFEFYAGPFGLMRVVTTIDELELSGAEVDFRFAATDNLRIDGSYGMTDGEIIENVHRPYTVGNDAPLTPENTLNLGVQYDTHFGAYASVFRLDYAVIGETSFHTVQDNTTRTIWQSTAFGFDAIGGGNFNRTIRDSYETLDMRITLTRDNWGVSAWGRNVLDEEYLAEVINAPEFGGSFIHEAPAASFGVDIKYTY